jgi:sodium transport system permease protein
VTILNQQGSAPWHLWVPALAQTALMGRVLKGEVLPLPEVALTVAIALAVTVVAVVFVARTLRSAALK